MARLAIDRELIDVWGVPFTPYRLEESLDRIDQLIEERRPTYALTANLNYAMLTEQNPRLREINEHAAFILADGMPLIWASRLQKTPLPERVAGSDLIWKICERAAQNGHRLFILGGAPGVGDLAAAKLRERFPGIQVVGILAPPFRKLSEAEEEAVREQIRAGASRLSDGGLRAAERGVVDCGQLRKNRRACLYSAWGIGRFHCRQSSPGAALVAAHRAGVGLPFGARAAPFVFALFQQWPVSHSHAAAPNPSTFGEPGSVTTSANPLAIDTKRLVSGHCRR